MNQSPNPFVSIFIKTSAALEAAWAWLARPHASLQDLARRRRAQLMMAIALTITLSMLGPVFFGHGNGVERLSTLGSFLALSFISFLLGRTRFYKWGSVLLVFGLAGMGFALVLTGQANNASNALNTTLPLALVIGSALFALRGQLLLTLVCGFGPMLLPLINPRLTIADGMGRDGGIFLVLGLLLIAVTVFRNRLEQTRMEELRAANTALQAIQSTLEERVSERTRAAEAARSQAEAAVFEAEDARQKVEAQAWLTTGQAALAEKIRGEKTVERLAEDIIVQLCKYTGSQAGALFLLEGQKLKMLGCYAFTERPGFDGEFQLGEGLIGQAAADNRILHLNKVPPEALVISTGLVSLVPRQVLVAPFSTDGEVGGVIELVTLSGFYQTQLEFMARISESVAIAFRSTQTRQRLAKLLMESQQQAEELQVQEEELRAANEELRAQAENLQAIRSSTARK